MKTYDIHSKMLTKSSGKLKVGVIDLVFKGSTNSLFARVMYPNLASIMPQVVATWCEQEGHDVQYLCYTGIEDLRKELPDNIDILFICAFTHAALMAYSLSNLFRSKGAVTVLGGPHARCYPDDALKYFDYVTGFTDKDVVIDILKDAKKHRPVGIYLSAEKQPTFLAGVKERWKFIEPTIKKAPFMKVVPMIGSMGCPYTCSFCIDSQIPLQTMEYEQIKEDLSFLTSLEKSPIVGWHDPNFGIRFNEIMDVIESAVKPGSLNFLAESSLAVLTEKNLKRLQKSGFVGTFPGIESWYEMGNKSKTSNKQGLEKVNLVADHINMIFRYIPYIQANFVFGLDNDFGPEPFELTKKFTDLSPAVFPGCTLLTAYGEAAPSNLAYQEEDRILPFPFHFLNNLLAMNVRPKNYDWITFYDHMIDLTAHTHSWKSIRQRFMANLTYTAKWLNFVRAISLDGLWKLRFLKKIRNNLVKDQSFRDYFEGNSTDLPQFYRDIIRKDLGYMWKWLPDGAMYHDHKAYLNKSIRIESIKTVVN